MKPAQLYSPIVKGKLNDLKALGSLSSASRSKIKPLIEAMPLPKAGEVDKHLHRFAHYIVKHVPLGEIFVDFYGLEPNLKTSDGVSATLAGFRLLKALGRTVTPTYGFWRDEEPLRDDVLWDSFRSVINSFGQGFCFRIDMDDLDDQAEDTWAQIIERSSQLGLSPSNTDLLIDLRYLADRDLEELKNIVLDFLQLTPNGLTYRSIILVGSSALKTVANIPKDSVGIITRRELYLWTLIQRDLPESLSLIYGDYGIIHPDFSDLGPNKYMNAKIRYTTRGRIFYFRGHGLSHPIKDYEQYHELADRVRGSGNFMGRDFSVGDRYIDNVADFHIKPGSPATWVRADMNHHIEYTAKQMADLVVKVRVVEDQAELEEMF